MQDATTQPADTGADAGTQALQGQPDSTSPVGFSREDLSVGLIALGSIMMLIVIARMLGRRRSALQADAHASKGPRQAAAPAFTSTAAHDRLERLMADAEELTRRLAAVLDNRAARIELLIEQADERLRELETGHAQTPPATSEQAAPAPAGSHGPPDLAISRPAPATGDPVDPLHRKVYDLADQGLGPVDIARKIDKPTGQVELILALRRA